MKAIGNIRKMQTRLTQPVSYHLPLFNNLEEGENIPLNTLIGRKIMITFLDVIQCIVTGKVITKTYGEGLSYDAYKSSPLAAESILRPELSQAHLGIGLRDLEWEERNDLQPHFVYLALTNKVKVGVTRQSNLPHRWIDQGAWKTIIFAETPYRQLAGKIEVEMKNHISDKTSWQRMLTNEKVDINLLAEKQKLADCISDDLKPYISDNNEITEIHYPVMAYPNKVKSLKLDKNPVISKRLQGIRGQYLIFEDETVFNVRSHSGYKIMLEW